MVAKIIIVSLTLAFSISSAISAESLPPLEIETGFDVLHSPNTTIEGLHRFYVGLPTSHNFRFGQAIYSSAYGDGGGAFFWGFEVTHRTLITSRLSASLSGFIGGGGGASQVNGDGTMGRLSILGDYELTPGWGLQAGMARIKVNGSAINDWATTLGVRFTPFKLSSTNRSADWGLRSASLRFSRYTFPNTLTRSAKRQNDLSLMGAEARFFASEAYEVFIGADGAASGSDGYMQVQGGIRGRWPVGPVSFFGESSLGFGGGGDVDTGGGFLVGAAIGAAFELTPYFDLEIAYRGQKAIDTQLSGHGININLSRVFNRYDDHGKSNKSQRWQIGLGLSSQVPNDNYMKAGNNKGIHPLMQETSIDLFLTENVYLTGNAQTTVNGGVAGFAIGLLGLGYEFELNDSWQLALEGHIGAAGGGGVDVGSGFIGGLRAEIDYLLSSKNAVSFGFGILKSNVGGMRIPIFQIGLKHKFSTGALLLAK